MVVIGSTALKQHISLDRNPKDYDLLIERKDYEKILKRVSSNAVPPEIISDKEYCKTLRIEGDIFEFLIADDFDTDMELLNMDFPRVNIPGLGDRKVCPLDYLYSIKLSHIYYHDESVPRFLKHASDISKMRKILGKDKHFEFTKRRRKHMEKVRGPLKTPTLKGKTKGDFFDDNVVKPYVHDDIHRVVAHKELPMYSYMQEEGSEVECSKELWSKFSTEDKAKTVLEESYVIACERLLIPVFTGASRKLVLPDDAFKWAYMRVSTTLCSGFFRAFAARHHDEIMEHYNPDFYKPVVQEMIAGTLKENK